MINKKITYTVVGILFFIFSCTNEQIQQEQEIDNNIPTIFKKLSISESGISFANNLKEDSTINYFTYPYIYMGGGVAVADFNNDGLQDVYFTGNMVKNGLFLNKGDLKFEDITEISGTGADDRWVTGVTTVDINADGWMDIYVSVSGKFTTTKNLLFINNGLNSDGIPTFRENAEERGIADESHSTQATFFDYDKDGDLDLYVANYPYTSFKMRNESYLYLINKKSPEKSDHLFRNKGDGFFEDITAAAGLLNFGLSLSATVGDFNQDGWEDIYVSNDFATPDHIYFNNGDGTFTDKIKETTQHTAFYGMGADIGDFNNDGLLDLLQMDMTPADNRRNKANMASMNIPAFWEIVNMGMHYQYMQNALQLNNGITKDGLPHFSDISRISGMSSTDWSWAGLFADLDNDGWKDVFITNGTRRDINNKDYFKKVENASFPERKKFNNLDLTKNMPSEKVGNYAYKNNGDLSFTSSIDKWGLGHEGFTNGAAYADFDNDGDLDIVINNIDEAAIIFQNKTSDLHLANYLNVKLKGSKNNPKGIGVKILLKNGEAIQYQELTLTRGFQSSVEPIIHFGLGKENSIAEMNIIWPDGKHQQLKNISANQLLEIDYQNAKAENSLADLLEKKKQIFKDQTQELGIHFKHKENYYDDFQEEILLPHAYSRNGPGLAVGDVNGDQLEDFYIGAARDSIGVIFLQKKDGSFMLSNNNAWQEDADKEDMGATFFDADNDGDLDLYVISGSNEHAPIAASYKDRLYLNDGAGHFTKTKNTLPDFRSSGSRVKAADYDNDGDMDLFIGGRLIPRSYPMPAKSFILKNEGMQDGQLKFTDVTQQVAPDLMKAGLVTDAVWVDFDQDKNLDLVVVGEWMPITFLKNNPEGSGQAGNTFVNKTKEYGLEKSTGWWYSIIADDFDKDGDMDLVAGNLGLNYKYQASQKEPFDVYAYDYDKNGKLDIVLGYYNDGIQYPVRGKQCSSEQIPTIGVKYKDYNTFAEASLADVYTKHDLEASLHYQAYNFASSYIENKDGNFRMTNLPNPTQLSSINGIISEDFDGDGNLDILVAGNLFASEVETTRNDASYGQLLKGDGKGHFKVIPFSESGFYLQHDTKDLKKIKTTNGIVILAASNNEMMSALKMAEQ